MRGADSKIDQSGLVIFSGSLQLGRPVGFESLDDRVNSRWRRGAPVLIDVASDSNILTRPNRFGTLFVTDAVYDRADGNTGRLNIEVTDILGLLANKQGEEGETPKACADEGGTPALSAINQLLTLAGVPSSLLLLDPVPGNINAPTNGGGGYIQQAGAIAASQGWFLYVDGITGRVRARSINVDQTTPLYSLSVRDSATDFQRLPDRPPAQKVTVKGTGKIVTPVPQLNTQTVARTYGTLSSIGGFGEGELLVRERYTTESITGNVRTLNVVVYEALGSLFPTEYPGDGGRIEAENYTEIHTYEAQTPVTTGGTDCENGNQGRLLSSVITSRKCFGVVFRGLVAIGRAKALSPAITFSDAQLIPLTNEYTEVTRYEYTPPETLTGQNRGRGPLITRRKIGRLGAIMPDYFSSKGYRPINSFIYDLAVDTEQERSYWFQTSPTEWRYEHTLRQSQIIAKEAEVARSHEAAKKLGRSVDAQNYASLVTVEESVTTNGNNTPPAPETLPAKYTIEQKDASATYVLPQDANWEYRDRTQALSFDYLSGNTAAAINSQAYALARIWGVIGWGRYRGNTVSGAMSDYLLSTYRPGDMVAVEEEGWVSHNLADGYSIGIEGEEMLVGLDLMYMGRVDPPLGTQAQNTVITLDEMRAIPPNVRYDGMIAFSPN